MFAADTSWPRAMTASAKPIWRYNSSVRACTATAREVVPGSAVWSMIRTATPMRVSQSATVRPVGPAPTISTCARGSDPISSIFCSRGCSLRSDARVHGLHAAPEGVGEPPEHAGARRPAPHFRTIAHREVSDQRRAEGDREAAMCPLLEPRWQRREQQHDAEQLGPCELHPEVVGETEVSEHRRHLRQAQLCVGGEAYLQAEECGNDPEAEDDSFGARHAQVCGRERRSRCGDRQLSGLHGHNLPPYGATLPFKLNRLVSGTSLGMTERPEEM